MGKRGASRKSGSKSRGKSKGGGKGAKSVKKGKLKADPGGKAGGKGKKAERSQGRGGKGGKGGGKKDPKKGDQEEKGKGKGRGKGAPPGAPKLTRKERKKASIARAKGYVPTKEEAPKPAAPVLGQVKKKGKKRIRPGQSKRQGGGTGGTPVPRPAEEALAAAQSFWDSIKASEDVWVSSNLADPATDPEKNRAPCMVPSRLMSMALAFWQRGGLCDPTPGRRNFELGVRRERIRSSGMMLRVVATSLKTGQAKWWDEKSDRIIEGCEASGAIAPIIYPMEVDSEGFVDGGFVANTPIMKALEDGAQTVVVVNLDPVNTTGLIPDLEALSKAGIDVGLSIVEFEFNMMQQRYFLEHELQMACFGFPDRRILAFTPRTDPGNFLSFSGKALQRMREQGIETVRASAPVDLCKSFFRPAHRGQMNVDLPPHPVAVETFLATNVTPMDLRFALLCFMLGLTSGLALRRVACGRFQPVTDVALDV